MVDLLDTYGVAEAPKRSIDNPRMGEVAIPKETKRWRSGLSKLPALLSHVQEMANRFAIEMAVDRQKRQSPQPHATPCLSNDRWRSFYPARAMAMVAWGGLRGPRKNPSPTGLSFQAWVFYNLRFLHSVDHAGAWAPLAECQPD